MRRHSLPEPRGLSIPGFRLRRHLLEPHALSIPEYRLRRRVDPAERRILGGKPTHRSLQLLRLAPVPVVVLELPAVPKDFAAQCRRSNLVRR